MPGRQMIVRSAGGLVLRHYGRKVVTLSVEPMQVVITFEVADVRRPLLSVKKMTKHGHNVIFTDEEACLVRLLDGGKQNCVVQATQINN